MPSKRVEAKRAGMIPTARLRNPLGRRYRYAAAAAAAAAPSTSPWSTHAREPEPDDEEESDDGEQIGIAASTVGTAPAPRSARRALTE